QPISTLFPYTTLFRSSLMKSFGRYLLLLGSLFRNREKFRTYVKLIIDEAVLIGIDSVFIVVIVSTFIGAVTAVQTAYNLVSPLRSEEHTSELQSRENL